MINIKNQKKKGAPKALILSGALVVCIFAFMGIIWALNFSKNFITTKHVDRFVSKKPKYPDSLSVKTIKNSKKELTSQDQSDLGANSDDLELVLEHELGLTKDRKDVSTDDKKKSNKEYLKKYSRLHIGYQIVLVHKDNVNKQEIQSNDVILVDTVSEKQRDPYLMDYKDDNSDEKVENSIFRVYIEYKDGWESTAQNLSFTPFIKGDSYNLDGTLKDIANYKDLYNNPVFYKDKDGGIILQGNHNVRFTLTQEYSFDTKVGGNEGQKDKELLEWLLDQYKSNQQINKADYEDANIALVAHYTLVDEYGKTAETQGGGRTKVRPGKRNMKPKSISQQTNDSSKSKLQPGDKASIKDKVAN